MYKILLVEDEELISNMYRFELFQRNFDVVLAKDGEEALFKVRSEMPDFILLDVMLPRIDGIAFFKELLRDEKIKRIPVGFVSALGHDIADFVGQDCETVEKAVFFLEKDAYTPKQVVDEVEKYLSGKSAFGIS